MRLTAAFLLIILCVSCDIFGGKPSKEELVNREMQSINWNEVDQYPLFEACDETADKTQQRRCFQTTFTNQVFETLQNNHIVVHKSLNDTVKVHMLISNTGTIKITGIEKTDVINKQIPQLDSIINESLKQLPKLYPAIKRDIPVSTKIKLPIVLKAD